MATVHEQLSEQFYQWELRGRGWQAYDGPVDLEPPFVPFIRSYPVQPPVIDDGRKPTFMSSLFRKSIPPPPQNLDRQEREEEPKPATLIREPLTELQMVFPAKMDASYDSLERFFASLSFCKEPIAFEVLGLLGHVTIQFAAAATDAVLLERQLTAHFPQSQVKTRKDTLALAWVTCSGEESVVAELGLKHEFMYSLANGKGDPFVGIIAALSKLRPGELGLFQVLWQPVRKNWRESILRSVTDEQGNPFFVNTPELSHAAERKVAKPLYATVVRIATKAGTFDESLQIASDVAGALQVFSNPQGNQLIPLKNDIEAYSTDDHIVDLIFRQSRRSGMILNSEELAGFVHLPSDEVQSPVLVRDSGASKAAPEIVRRPPGIVIGDNEHLGDVTPVYLSADLRVRHTHIIGISGTGKSSLLFNMIRQDIESGDGVAVLDPHGDLIKQILGIIPEGRINDVSLMDTSDTASPVGFNILEAHSAEERDILASDLIAVFRRLSTSWGDQMDTVLHNAILAILKSERGGTLRDLQRFLAETQFRNEFLNSVQDHFVRDFWKNIFPHLTGGKSVGSVLARLQDFFSREPIRNIVSQRTNKLDFSGIMDNRKIFLARLPKGLGNENSYLLGTLLISKFQQIAMARASQDESQRSNFWIYIDEFANFITPSMAEILAETRKYRVGLTLAHHQLHQLQGSPDVANAVMAHPCTRIVFRVEDSDAKKLAEGFESFEAGHLKTLEMFHAICRVERNDFDFSLTLRKPEMPEPAEAEERRKAVVAASRAKYATPKAEVEATLQAGMRSNKPMARPEAPPVVAPLLKPPSPPVLSVAEPPPEPLPQALTTPPQASEIPKDTVSGKNIPKPPRDLGRGGPAHQAIQERLQAEAQKLGFWAEVEKQLAKGSGEAADLILKRDGVAIAVEIMVTSSASHEFENIQKCLAGGFERVAVIATSQKRLADLAAIVKGALGAEAAAKAGCYLPDEFIAELRKLATELDARPKAPLPPNVEKRWGMTVRRHLPQLSDQEQRLREDAVNRVLAEAMRRRQK